MVEVDLQITEAPSSTSLNCRLLNYLRTKSPKQTFMSLWSKRYQRETCLNGKHGTGSDSKSNKLHNWPEHYNQNFDILRRRIEHGKSAAKKGKRCSVEEEVVFWNWLIFLVTERIASSNPNSLASSLHLLHSDCRGISFLCVHRRWNPNTDRMRRSE